MNKFILAALVMLAFNGMATERASCAAGATGRVDCVSAPSKILGRAVRYCVILPPSYDADKTRHYPVLYLLHGLGDNEQMLVHSGGFNLVEDLWEHGQLGEFLIVTPAGEASFYINARDGQHRYENFFLQEFLPLIERRYRTRAGRASRGIAGVSMGGYGALHLAFRHPELFGSVGVHSAALMEKLPVVQAGDSRQPMRVRILGDVFGAPVDGEFWKRNDPLVMARTANLAGVHIYFDCGTEDDFGFDAGATTLDKELTARHVAHEFHLYPGGHNWAYVAEHLPALLRFHDGVFAAGAAGLKGR